MCASEIEATVKPSLLLEICRSIGAKPSMMLTIMAVQILQRTFIPCTQTSNEQFRNDDAVAQPERVSNGVIDRDRIQQNLA